MKEQEFDKERLLDLIGGMLDGWLDRAGQAELARVLKSSSEAREIYRKQTDLHARLHLDHAGGLTNELMRGLNGRQRARRLMLRRLTVGAVAACLALAAAVFWLKPSATKTFVSIESTRSARWEDSALPTVAGTRLGQGTLRLAEGLATLRFDSGAELTLEAPAELTLVDAMQCTLDNGIVMAEVPQAAKGFLITTPNVRVVDYGTRFSVFVDGATNETHTQVYEGLVELEHAASRRKVRLEGGQLNSAGREDFGETLTSEERSSWPLVIGPAARGPEWRSLTTTRDAYIGRSIAEGREVHNSETLLLVKNGTVLRKAYLAFDLAGIEADRIAEAELSLEFAPTGWGLASLVPDATFSVFGLQKNASWDEKTITPENAPANRRNWPGLDLSKVSKLGSFVIPQGVQSGRFEIEGDALVEFLRRHAGAEITLIVIRETRETKTNGLVHGFASRRHPSLRPPTLAIRLAQP